MENCFLNPFSTKIQDYDNITDVLLNIKSISSFHISRMVLYCKTDKIERPVKMISENFLTRKQSEFFVSSYEKEPGNLVLTSIDQAIIPFPFGIGEKLLAEQFHRDFKSFAEKISPYFYVEIVFSFPSYATDIGQTKHSIDISLINEEFKNQNMKFLLMDLSVCTMRLGLFNENEFTELCYKKKSHWTTKLRDFK